MVIIPVFCLTIPRKVTVDVLLKRVHAQNSCSVLGFYICYRWVTPTTEVYSLSVEDEVPQVKALEDLAILWNYENKSLFFTCVEGLC